MRKHLSRVERAYVVGRVVQTSYRSASFKIIEKVYGFFERNPKMRLLLFLFLIWDAKLIYHHISKFPGWLEKFKAVFDVLF